MQEKQLPLCRHRYVFSTDVARALVETNAIAPLKFMPNEDATFGFWVMGMNLRHVDQPKVLGLHSPEDRTAQPHTCMWLRAEPCCAIVQRSGLPSMTTAAVQLCAMLHIAPALCLVKWWE